MSERPDGPTPDEDPRRYVALYKNLNGAHRHAVNVLYRHDGRMQLEEFLRRSRLSPQAILKLQAEGILALQDSLVALPAEYLFAIPLRETDQDTLVECLKQTPPEVLRRKLAALGIDPSGANREETLRALLYEFLQGSDPWKGKEFDAIQERALRLVAKNDFALPLDKFWREFALGPVPRQPCNPEAIHAALGALPGDSLATLFDRCLLFPMRRSWMVEYWDSIGIPRELRGRMEGLNFTGKGGAAAASRGAVSFAKTFERDFKRLLVWIHAFQPRLTQSGRLYKKDMEKALAAVRRDGFFLEWSLFIAAKTGLSRTDKDGRLSLDVSKRCDLSRSRLERFARDEFSNDCRRYWYYLGDGVNAGDVAGEIWKTFAASIPSPEGALRSLEDLTDDLLRKYCRRDIVRRESRQYAIQTLLPFTERAATLLWIMGFLEGEPDEERGVGAVRWAPPDPRRGEDSAAESPSIIVQPNHEIICPIEAPADDLLTLASFCEIKSLDTVAIFGVSKSGLIAAYRRGEDLGPFLEFLRRRSKNPLPQGVEFLLNELIQRSNEILIEPAVALIRFDREEIAREALAILGKDHGIDMVAPCVGAVRRLKHLNNIMETLDAGSYLIRPIVLNEAEIMEDAKELGLPMYPAIPNGGDFGDRASFPFRARE